MSDTLLIFLLKAHRSALYRETIRIDIRREAERLAAELGRALRRFAIGVTRSTQDARSGRARKPATDRLPEAPPR